MPVTLTARTLTVEPLAVTLVYAETDGQPNNEFTVDLPPWAQSFRADHHLTAGPAATIQPEYGFLPGWVSGEDGHIDETAAPAANHTVYQRRNLPADARALYVRTRPDVDNTGGSVTHRITVYADPEG